MCELIIYDIYIRLGYPELGLPVFDPLRLQKLDIEQGENFFLLLTSNRNFFLHKGGNSPVNLKIHLKNFDLAGLSGVKFTSIQGFQKDFNNQKTELKFTIPSWQILGPYKVRVNFDLFENYKFLRNS